MTYFIAPDLNLKKDMYFHTFTTLDEKKERFGIYTNADERNTRKALEDLYANMPRDEESRDWLLMGDAIANTWEGLNECVRAMPEELAFLAELGETA